MIKIKAKLDVKNNTLNWNYKGKKTNSLENICVIWNLMDNILANNSELTENDLLEIFKNRKKYIEDLGVMING